MRDPLAEQLHPTHWRTYQLAVDVSVRYGQLGIFVRPQILQQQRTGRMRRLAGAVEVFFKYNFNSEERRLLVPWGERMFSESLDWANWASWGQRALLCLAYCAGERGEADLQLKTRGANVAVGALVSIVPELHAEFGAAFSIRG